MRWIVALVGLVIATLLLGLGAPRLVASLAKAPAFSAVLAAQHGKAMAPAPLERAIGHLQVALPWDPSGRARTDLGFLLLLQSARSDPSDPLRVASAQQAAEALRAGLRLAPVQPHSWVRLAYARAIETGPTPEVAGLLAGSVKAGAFVGEITLARLDLLLRAWEHLPADLRSYCGRQIRYAWENDRGRLIDIARISSRRHIIRFALRSLPGALDRFDAAIPPGSG